MDSKVGPNFVLNASKICHPSELREKTKESLAALGPEKSPPITPAPSASNTEEITNLKKTIQRNIQSSENKGNDSARHKMELINERLERSRERYKERMRLQDESLMGGDPTGIRLDGISNIPCKFDRSVSDMGPINRARPMADGPLPYVYFVIDQGHADNRTGEMPFENNIWNTMRISKSAEKRKKVRIVEEQKQRREKRNKAVKLQGLARELGLKSKRQAAKQSDTRRSAPQPSVSQIEFPHDVGVPAPPGYMLQGAFPTPPSTAPNVHSIHSPLRNLRGRSAATVIHEHVGDIHGDPDPDDTVPRKPFISEPMYCGKPTAHSCSMQTFELPVIIPEQRRRPLPSEKFGDMAYLPKPPSAPRQRQVTFTDSLPVIRGSGFVLNDRDLKEDNSVIIIPDIGPRATTMGSIVLPSEYRDKQEVCQRFASRDNPSVKMARKAGIPLPLPKVDIVSTVHDEMIIKMIKDYLQDPNTSERQAQLAHELLDQLEQDGRQKESRKKEENISARRSGGDRLHTDRERQKTVTVKHVTLTVPANKADEHSSKPSTPKTDFQKPDASGEVPFVQITYKQRPDEVRPADEHDVGEETSDNVDDQLDVTVRQTQDRQTLNAVQPKSFKMAPPGLSKKDTDCEMANNHYDQSGIDIKA